MHANWSITKLINKHLVYVSYLSGNNKIIVVAILLAQYTFTIKEIHIDRAGIIYTHNEICVYTITSKMHEYIGNYEIFWYTETRLY